MEAKDMDTLKWEKVTEVQGRLEAELLESFLEANGIDVELFQESVGHSAYPVMVDGLGRVQVFVPKDKIQEARELIKEFNEGSNREGTMPERDTVILISNYGLGKGPQELQLTLMAKYLDLLAQQTELPAAICFYTEGVRLVVEGSPVIESLKALEERGVRLIICSTCLNYFGLEDKLRIGIIGGMGDIIEAQWKARKVITI
jgi:selenium metabolism protein YedF